MTKIIDFLATIVVFVFLVIVSAIALSNYWVNEAANDCNQDPNCIGITLNK